MLKKLKIKFVIVIMLIVTLLFSAVFCGIIYFTKENIEHESIQMMKNIPFSLMNSPVPIKPPDDMSNNARIPFFNLEKNKNGEIKTFGGDYYDLSNQDFIEKLFNIADSNKNETGIIVEYNLRYVKNSTPNGIMITFADISNEKLMLNGFVRNSLIIGFIGYIIFFLISLILAKWVTKPVEMAWNEQKQFIADASHELKTPLTVIMTNAEMLIDTDYSENEKNGFTKNILSMSKRMRGLVESLLELARMDNGILQKNKENIDYSKLISTCILPFEPLYYEKNIELNPQIEQNIFVEGDKVKLRQVIDILLDNALKYSNENSSVNIILKHQNTSHCILYVENTGRHLSKTECRNIFKRFYRIDESRKDGNSYGLGLAIADSIIKEHHGKIWAESNGKINTFFVYM